MPQISGSTAVEHGGTALSRLFAMLTADPGGEHEETHEGPKEGVGEKRDAEDVTLIRVPKPADQASEAEVESEDDAAAPPDAAETD